MYKVWTAYDVYRNKVIFWKYGSDVNMMTSLTKNKELSLTKTKTKIKLRVIIDNELNFHGQIKVLEGKVARSKGNTK